MRSLSILISSHNRLQYLRRTLYTINEFPPNCPFEVVLADDGSTDDIVGELSKYDFDWTFVQVDNNEFEKKTGIKHYFNNPSLTNNVAFKHSRYRNVCLLGNDIMVMPNCLQTLNQRVNVSNVIMFPTTYDLGEDITKMLNEYGSNLTNEMIGQCLRYPLQHFYYNHSDVTNYGSVCSRELWEIIGGYDERYVGGIACDDSDFIRRAKAFGASTQIHKDAFTLHQWHGGNTQYYTNIDKDFWEQGLKNSRPIYAAWDGKTYYNPQGFPWGTFGVTGVITNVR